MKKSTYSLKVLELVAKAIGDSFAGWKIIQILKSLKIPDEYVNYPNTKWRTVYEVFEHIKNKDTDADNTISKIITEFIHPLNHNADEELARQLSEKIEKYLAYDKFYITGPNNGLFVVDEEEMDEIHSIPPQKGIEQDKKETKTKKEEVKVLPDVNKSTYSEKVIELIAEEFCNIFSNYDIRKIITPIIKENAPLYNQRAIKGYLIDEMFEENPFDTFRDTLEVIRTKDERADKTISKIIVELLHPLNHHADEEKSKILAGKINRYLKYNNLNVINNGKGYLIFSDTEMNNNQREYEALLDTIDTVPQEAIDEIESERNSDEARIKIEKNKIKTLRDSHQSYIDIIELFCRDTKRPTKELNDAYLFLTKKIEMLINELGFQYYTLVLYKPFKNDLYSAEIEWNGSGIIQEIKLGPKLSWDAIRPSLYRVHSDITKIYNISEEDTQMTDDEKTLEEITSLISQKRTQKTVVKESQKTMKIEISKMPDLNIKNTDERILVKKNKKRITLPSFSRTDWSKVTIKFLSERDILLSNEKDTKQSSFDGLGCDDGRNDKPDDNWDFLLKLAKNNGQTLSIGKKEREKQKKQKQKITDILRRIFKNDTDPFEKEKGGVYKAKFVIKYLNEEVNETNTSPNFLDLNEIRSEMTESTQENIEDEFSQ